MSLKKLENMKKKLRELTVTGAIAKIPIPVGIVEPVERTTFNDCHDHKVIKLDGSGNGKTDKAADCDKDIHDHKITLFKIQASAGHTHVLVGKKNAY